MKRILAFILVALMITAMLPVSALALNQAGVGANATSSSDYTFGCDLSYWNVDGNSLKYSLVDFNKMVADGCDFAILRMCVETDRSGNIYLDKAFLKYYESARAAGMKLGIYMYSYALTYEEAKADAEWVMNTIEKYDMYFEYPIYIDVETEAQNNLSSSKKSSMVSGWCETLEANGYFPGIYAIRSFLRGLNSTVKSKYDLWVAHVKSDSASGEQYNWNSLDYSDEFSMWQYAWYGRNYDGVKLNMLDVNVSYKNYPTIMETYGYNNCGSPEKSLLYQAIATAKEKKYSDYSESALDAFRKAYDKAVSVYNNSSSGNDDYKNARVALEETMNAKTNVLSVGKKYTTNISPRDDMYKDDGIRLTDGNKQNSDPGTAAYSGWADSTEIVVDLGSSQTSNAYKVYLAACTSWGIAVPDSSNTKLEIFSSDDKSSWKSVGSSSDVQDAGNYDADWKLRTITLESAASVTARYIKFVVTGNGHIWMDEVEVISGDASKLSGGIYINGLNERVSAGSCSVFTSSFGEITIESANHAWTVNVIASWSDEQNAFVVKSVTVGTGDNTPNITLKNDEILIAAHSWDGTNENPVVGSGVNAERVLQLKVGDLVYLSGIDTVAGQQSVGAYMTVAHVHEPGNDADCDNPQVCKTCNAVIVSALGHDQGEIIGNELKCTRCGKVLEVIPEDEPKPDDDVSDESSNDQSSDDEASNDEPSKDESSNDESVDETEDSDDETSKDEDEKPVEEDKKPVDDNKKPIEDDKTPEIEFSGLRGDLNDNFKIDMTDYILLKRYYFNTYDLDETQLIRSDIDENGKVNMTDYILLKRTYFGTYTIKNIYVK